MTTEERLLKPAYGPDVNPRLEFRDGQFLFRTVNLEGAVVERFISSAAAREAFSGIPIDSGWLPPEIVRWGNGKLGEWCIAYIPPRVHELELTQEPGLNSEWKETANITRLPVPLPGLVFFGLSNLYHIWAVKTVELIPSHEIYRCPLPNVEETGLICWGPYRPPRCTAKSIFDAFDLFIKSTFNNHRADGKSHKYREDVRLMLREVAGTKPYPVNDLMRQVPRVGIGLDTAIRQFFETGCVISHE
jgi:E2/UBC family protein D